MSRDIAIGIQDFAKIRRENNCIRVRHSHKLNTIN
jgi:hypothetical protein